MFGCKGQTEAPFQLLIAAVMLSMVLPISFYLFQQFQVWESQERVKNNMETLARELETVANLGEGEKYISVDLSVYGGPNFRIDGFDLYKPSQDICMTACHTPHCMLLRAYKNQTDIDRPLMAGVPQVCVRIPFNVDFKTQGCSSVGQGLSDLMADPWGESGVGFEPGFHSFVAIKKGYSVYLCESSGGANDE